MTNTYLEGCCGERRETAACRGEEKKDRDALGFGVELEPGAPG